MFVEETHGYVLKPSGWPNRIAALCLMAYCAPLIVLIALAVKFESNGPVFVHANINGRNILRFRTTSTEETNRFRNSARKFVSDDATRLGAFLQVTRLEFLPRLWNVAAGEYSIANLLR